MNIEKARDFILNQARPLEKSVYLHLFEEGDCEEVRRCLLTYQNDDGGFGNAIEPDIRMPGSSVLCTTVGLQTAVQVGLRDDDPIVQAALHYLTRSFDEKLDCWRATPLEVNDFAHAPWWHQDPSAEISITALKRNPGLEAASYFARWQRNDFVDWLMQVVSDVDTLEHHEMLCLARLAETPNLSSDLVAQIRGVMNNTIVECVETNPEAWTGYCLKPLDVVLSPDSFLAPKFVESVFLQFDFESNDQREDGSWSPPWNWGESYPEAWPIACREWAGVLTLDKLRRWHAFN